TLPEPLLLVIKQKVKESLRWHQLEVLDQILTELQPWEARHIRNSDHHNLENELAPLDPFSLCHVLGPRSGVALHILKSFPKQSHPLSEWQNLLALRQLGIVFTLDLYLQYVQIPLESIPDTVPLLHFDSFKDVLLQVKSLVMDTTTDGYQLTHDGRTGPNQALQLLRIPFVGRQILSKPAKLIYFLAFDRIFLLCGSV
ncbi:hypothetical protein BVRB_018920, partial [Beta vulgaris subsp. vulgaris]